MIVYYRLWDYLNRHNMKRTDLLSVISSATLAKLGKNANIETAALNRICRFLNVRLEQIAEYISDDNSD